MPEPTSSPFSISPNALQQARNAGYSDDEIVNFLSPKRPEQFKAAQEAGYSSQEILNHISGANSSSNGTNVYHVGLDDGRTLRIEADSRDAALAGAQHFMNGEKTAAPNIARIKGNIGKMIDQGAPESDINDYLAGEGVTIDHLKAKPSGVGSGLQQGVANLIQGAGETAKQFLGTDNSGFEKAAKAVAPYDYHGATVVPEGGHWYDPRTYNYSAIPQALAEAAPGITQDLMAARAAAKLGGTRAGLAAGVGSMALRTLGLTAKNDAAIRTGNPSAEPEMQDKLRAMGTTAVQAVPQVIGLSRFLPGANKIATVGGRGAVDGVKRLAGTTATEGASNAAMDVIGQAGATVGTDKGLSVDPSQVANAAVVGGVGGGLLATPSAAGALARARILRKFGDDNQAASEAVANRMATAAEGNRFGTSAEPVHTASGDIKSALADALITARAHSKLDADANSAFNRAMGGRELTDTDISSIHDAVNGGPAGEQVMQLVRQANVMTKLKRQGTLTDDKFVGGVSSLPTIKHVLSRPITAIAGPAIGYGLGASQGLGWLAAHPGTIAGLGLGYAGLRGLDALTGGRAPAQRFVDTFANTSTPVRPVVSAGPQEAPVDHSMGPWGPRLPGPSVPQVEAPSLAPPEPSLSRVLRTNANIDQGMAKIVQGIANAKRKAMTAEATSVQPMLAEDGNTAPLQPELPKASVLPKVIRKLDGQDSTGETNFGGTHSSEEWPVPQGLKYTKISPADHRIAAQATDEFVKSGNVPDVVAQRYHNSAAMRQARIRDRLLAISGDPRFPSENVQLMESLDKLRHVRSREAVEREIDAIATELSHYGLHSILKEYFGPKWAASVWRPSRR